MLPERCIMKRMQAREEEHHTERMEHLATQAESRTNGILLREKAQGRVYHHSPYSALALEWTHRRKKELCKEFKDYSRLKAKHMQKTLQHVFLGSINMHEPYNLYFPCGASYYGCIHLFIKVFSQNTRPSQKIHIRCQVSTISILWSDAQRQRKHT